MCTNDELLVYRGRDFFTYFFFLKTITNIKHAALNTRPTSARKYMTTVSAVWITTIVSIGRPSDGMPPIEVYCY